MAVCSTIGLIIVSPILALWTTVLMLRIAWYAVSIVLKLVIFAIAFGTVRLERWVKGASYDEYLQLRSNATKAERILHSNRYLVKSGNCIPAVIAWCSGLVQETEIALASSKASSGTRSWRSCLAAARMEAVAVERANKLSLIHI